MSRGAQKRRISHEANLSPITALKKNLYIHKGMFAIFQVIIISGL